MYVKTLGRLRGRRGIRGYSLPGYAPAGKVSFSPVPSVGPNAVYTPPAPTKSPGILGALRAYIMSDFPVPTVSAFSSGSNYLSTQAGASLIVSPSSRPVMLGNGQVAVKKKVRVRRNRSSRRGCSCRGLSGCGCKRKSLGRLGDDGDIPTFQPDFSGDQSIVSSTVMMAPDTGVGYDGIAFGPQPTQATLQLNAAEGLAPGTSGTSTMPSALQSVIAAVAGGATNLLRTSPSAQTATSSTTGLPATIGGIPTTTLLWAAGGIAAVAAIVAIANH